jgi:hypothetical protein
MYGIEGMNCAKSKFIHLPSSLNNEISKTFRRLLNVLDTT